MRRFIAFDRQGNPLFDLDDRITSAVRTERLNGEHKLDIVTTQPLEEGMRILVRDGTLKWREWVVDEPDESHTEDGMEGTYGCTWSMQYDLATVDGGELWPGTYSPVAAGAALRMVLATQSIWEVGQVTVSGTAGTTLYDGQAWDYLGELLDVWGGEMEPRVEVDASGVTHRYVDWLAHVGNEEATRRFDFGEDCTSIRRKVAPGPRYCRVVPRGGRDAQDADGIRYSDRCGIEEEPYRKDGEFVHDANSKYVRDTVAEQLFRVPDGNGGWRYPEKVVCYDLDLAGDQEELLDKAMPEVAEHTRPKVTYEADVLQFAAAGLDPHGVQLGDEVQIVDRAFGDEPLRLQARVVEMTVNELDDTDVSLVIGEPNVGIEASFKSMRSAIDAAEGRARAIESDGTLVHLDTLIDQLNSEINATGGYWYAIPGGGTRTYDRAVSDPAVGSEATRVVETKGGSIRIANSRTSSGDWDWKTVFVSGHIAAELVTAVQVTAGFIGNENQGSYWDLDSGVLYISSGTTMQSALDEARKVATDYITDGTNGTDFGKSSTSSRVRITSVGMEVFDGSGNSALFAGLQDNKSIVRVGKASGSGNVVMSSDGYVDVRNASTIMAHFGYGQGRNASGGYSIAPYYDLGLRKSDSIVGNYSSVIGYNNTASGYASVAEGSGCEASGADSHAEGYSNTASGPYSHAGGYDNTTEAANSFVHGGYNSISSEAQSSVAFGEHHTISGPRSLAVGIGHSITGESCLVCGMYGTGYYGGSTSSARFAVGGGSGESSRKNVFFVGALGRVESVSSMWATAFNQTSDRRLKEHHKFIGDEENVEETCRFVRSLKPALFTKDGERHTGFYAQDVRDSDPWDTATVGEAHIYTDLDFTPLTISYTSLIAPLTAYAQQLERRIEDQQKLIESLVKRLDALDGGGT